MPAWNCFPDPDIQHGSFKVLPCTAGGYIIVDIRRPIGRRTVGDAFRSKEDAAETAKLWHEQGHG